MSRWRYERTKITDRPGIPVGDSAFLRPDGTVTIDGRTHHEHLEIRDQTGDLKFKRPSKGKLLTVYEGESRALFEFRKKKYAASYWLCWTLTEQARRAAAKPYHETPCVTWRHCLYWRDLLAETCCGLWLLLQFLLLIAWVMSLVGAIL